MGKTRRGIYTLVRRPDAVLHVLVPTHILRMILQRTVFVYQIRFFADSAKELIDSEAKWIVCSPKYAR